ncbi:MAG TPA: response regulator [Spongiibacteraceae bacterium]
MYSVDQKQFKKVLNRNVMLPLGLGLLTILFFTAIVLYLLAVNRWIEKTDTVIRSSNELLKLIVDQETGLRGFLITHKNEYLEPYFRGGEMTPAMIEKLRAMVDNSQLQKQRVETIQTTYGRWRAYAENAIEQSRNGIDAQSVLAADRGKQLVDEIRRYSGAFTAEEEDIKTARNERARLLVIALVIGFFAINILFSGLLAHLGRRQLLSLAASYDKLLAGLNDQNAVLRHEEWLRTGQLGLANQIIGQLPLPILCQNVLGFLAERLGVVVGALYVGQDEEIFRREANYGFSKENAQREQRFLSREGLVGQAAAERRIIHLSEAAPDYLKVNSGLGDGDPLHIVVVPVIVDTNVTAVLELGFFRPVDQRDFEFLERVAENIGAAIIAANYRRRLHDALQQMQQLNDELQAQQEELRAANEELEEQAQALAESQLRLESQHVELEQANDALHENNEMLRATRGLLEERALQLEQASRYKSEFLANMSHELRTPLNSALILSKLLADNASNNLTEEQVRFAGAIYAAGKDLLALINDVLDLSKVEAGKIDIIPGEVAIAHIAEMLETQFQPMAGEKNLEFNVIIADGAPAKINTDRQRLDQILRNLLSNAIKFTETGTVTVSIARYTEDAVTFAINDSGIGINAEQHELIFEPFRQVDATSNRRYGGTGLGLSISRDLATLLGGSLGLVSAPGMGSTFTLYLPCEYRPVPIETIMPQATAASHRGEHMSTQVNIPALNFDDDRDHLTGERTILVVEDEIHFARILYDLAHELNYRCLVAVSAEEAFQLAMQYTPAAILLDMKLPDHSGLSVLARLKDEPGTRHIPVHVISVEECGAVALQMGAVGFLSKPVSREQLREIFAKVENKLTNKMKHVLIVEDFSQHMESTAKLIADVDVEVVTVALGEQALRLLKEKVFDCMIMDFALSDMNGDQLLRRMTDEEICSFPPVIIHSSRNLNRNEEESLLRYSRSIIIKGVRSPERLLDEVTLFLHKVEADLSADRQNMLRQTRRRDRKFENRKILIVDDDVRNIFALTSLLENKGATIEIGRNGLDALKKLNDVDDIDLILMDIMMPEMDGYEAIETIRRDPRFVKLPIIAVTAKAMRDDQERCLRAGANDYIAKPVDLDRLLSLIRVWMPQVQRI